MTNGKGDAPRQSSDYEAYENNYDRIFPAPGPGRRCSDNECPCNKSVKKGLDTADETE